MNPYRPAIYLVLIVFMNAEGIRRYALPKRRYQITGRAHRGHQRRGGRYLGQILGDPGHPRRELLDRLEALKWKPFHEISGPKP